MSAPTGARASVIHIDNSDSDLIATEKIIPVSKPAIKQEHIILLISGISVFFVMSLLICLGMWIAHIIMQHEGNYVARLFQIFLYLQLGVLGLTILASLVFFRHWRVFILFFGEMVSNLIVCALIYYAIWKFMRNEYEPITVLYCTLIYFAVDVLWMVIFAVAKMKRLSNYAGWEVIQWMLIFWNLAVFHTNSWGWILLIWEIKYFLMYIFSFILLIFASIFLIVCVIQFRRISLKPTLIVLSILPIYFFVCWYSHIVWYIMGAIRRTFANGLIATGNAHQALDPSFFHFAKVIWWLSIVNLGLFVLGLICFIWLITLLTSNERDKIYVLQTYLNKMKIDYHLQGDSYFSPDKTEKKDGEDTAPLKPAEGKMDQCTICNDKDSEVLIRPCGHSGYCKDCLMKWIQQKPICPLCKKEITKFYLVEFDQEQHKYVAKGRIVLN